MNYYNENDPYCVEWLRNLITAGLLPKGDVDDRDIRLVQAADLAGYDQHHFFAGIGGWPLALELAGWPPDRPCWTGSCPCQPFSVAGKGKGVEDERHLWPEFFRLIEACRPPIIFGEQVASSEVVGTQLEAAFVAAVQRGDYAAANKFANRLVKSDSLGCEPRWVDGVFADLERIGYACRADDLPAAGVGADHIRQRLFWCAVRMADTNKERHDGREAAGRRHAGNAEQVEADCGRGRLANANGSDAGSGQLRLQPDGRIGDGVAAVKERADGGLAFTESPTGQPDRGAVRDQRQGWSDNGLASIGADRGSPWADSYVIECRDGRSRRVGRGVFPLAHGIPADVGSRFPELRSMAKGARGNRVGRLRGYGNAIVPQVAAMFIQGVMEWMREECGR